MALYKCFTRTWWKNNPEWPNGLEPSLGTKRSFHIADSEKEAQQVCKEYNDTHKPGRLSKKAEYEEIPPKKTRKRRSNSAGIIRGW